MLAKHKSRSAAAVLSFAGLIFSTAAAEPPVPPASNPPATPLAQDGFAKPAWLDELSAGVKEGYDDSVFLSSVDPKYYSSGYAVPAGSVAALRDRSSAVTTVSPKVAVNFMPFLGEQTPLKTLTLAYAPDFIWYHDQPSENYNAHRLSAAVKAGTDNWSFSLTEAFTYVDGDKYGPTYPGGYINAWNIVPPRERRKQIQDRATVAIQYDWNRWFIRPTSSLLYYGLMTEQMNAPGYMNYVTRFDVNGGADVGFKITPGLAATVGYRYGHQYQEQLSFSPYDSSDNYQRVLAGLEGRPWHWLDFRIQGGPDFRSYGAAAPVNNPNLVTYYSEASATATITTKDAVIFKYKLWQWISSIGKTPYFEGTYELTYHRRLTDKLGLDLGGRLITADYTSGNLAACQRDDGQYTVTAGLAYALNSHASLNLTSTTDLGRNFQAGVANPDTREYNQQLVSAGMLLKF